MTRAPETLRDAVIASRRTLGLSQRALARATGMQPHQISRYEAGKCDLYGETIDRLLAALGLAVTRENIDASPPRAP